MEFRRINSLPPYVFAEVNALKAEARRAGEDVIDLGFGNPDIESPPFVVDKLAEAASNPRNHRYSQSRGLPNLRKAVADRYERRFGVTLDWTLVHSWTYQRFPADALSSPYAQESRGLSDSMVGSLEFSVEVLDQLSVGVGTLVEQTPKTLDNERFRFPFWDTTNGAANRQVFYVDVIGTL